MPASQLTADLVDAETGASIPFNADPDADGVRWRMRKIEGWDSPDLEEAAADKSGQDGLWDVENFYGGRSITIEGMFSAPTYEVREAALTTLAQVVPRNRLVQLTLNEPVPKWVRARRSGRLMMDRIGERIAEFSVSMLAPDPRKYGTSLVQGTIAVAAAGGGLAPPWTPPILIPASSSGSSEVVLTNEGIYDSPPTVVIHGPGSGISIYNYTTSLLLAYDLDLGASDYLVVSVADGVALLNGTAPRPPASGSCVTSQWLMSPGANLIRIFGTLTDVTPPSADLSFYSAWT